MKKFLAIAFIGALALTSCEKKEVVNENDTMIVEPQTLVSDTVVVDSAAVVAPVSDTATAQ